MRRCSAAASRRAIARASYIDPRVIELYQQGTTIAPALPDLGKGRDFGDVATKGHAERAVLTLLSQAQPREPAPTSKGS